VLTLKNSRKYPVPEWEIEYAQLREKKLERNELAQFWDVRCREWVRLIKDSLGGDYHLHESEHFWLVGTEDRSTAAKILRWAEKCHARYGRTLDGIAPAKVGRIPMVVLRDLDTYYEYISEYYPEGEHGFSGGVYLYNGYGHFALSFKDLDEAERIIAHELVHAFLLGLTIPIWLNEGIAQLAEIGMTGRRYGPSEKFPSYWTERTAQEFWQGTGFNRQDEGQSHSYVLALLLTERLAKDMDRFRRFVHLARPEDAGYAALLEVYGVRLGDLAADHLGQGDWTPAAAGDRWKAQDNLHY
jgi:hypothetical protein